MKFWLICTILFIFVQHVHAQKENVFLSLGPACTIGLTNPSDQSSRFPFGIGGTIGIVYTTTKKGAILAKLTYYSLSRPQLPDQSLISQFMGMVGYKTQLGMSRFFVFGDAGMSLFASNGRLAISLLDMEAGAGYVIALGSKSFIDLSASLNSALLSAINNPRLGIAVNYRIQLNKY